MRKLDTLLVTGGAGFIGSAFIRSLFGASTFAGKIINLDALTYAGNLENLEGHVDVERYVFVKGDIRDQGLVEKLLQAHAVDAVVHFAAESHVDRSIHGPREFLETNIMGTFALLEALRAHKAGGGGDVHFHHVSTDEVFGSLGDSGFFTEDTAYDPRSPYSASNCSNNYGPCHFPEKLIPLMISNCLERKPLPVYGDGQNVRDWLYVDDHAEAIWLILQRGTTGATYNVGGRNEWKNLDLLHKLIDVTAAETSCSAAELHQLITFVKDRPGHDRRYAIDCSKIERELGWVPRHDFDSGLRETVRWYLAHPQWVQNIKSGAYKTWLHQNYAARD